VNRRCMTRDGNVHRKRKGVAAKRSAQAKEENAVRRAGAAEQHRTEGTLARM